MTHLFFVDDYLLFIKATLAECQTIKEILGWYDVASGQQLNQNKTTLFLSNDTRSDQKDKLIEVLRVPTVQQYEKYLGLLLMLVALKKSALLKSRKGCGGGFKGGRKNFYHNQRGSYQSRCSSYSNVFFKLFQTPQGVIVILRIWCENFGRDNEDSKIRFIGLNGTLCVGQKLMASRDFMIWRNSVMHYWENKYGDYSLFYAFCKAIFFPHSTIMEANNKQQ